MLGARATRSLYPLTLSPLGEVGRYLYRGLASPPLCLSLVSVPVSCVRALCLGRGCCSLCIVQAEEIPDSQPKSGARSTFHAVYYGAGL